MRCYGEVVGHVPDLPSKRMPVIALQARKGDVVGVRASAEALETLVGVTADMRVRVRELEADALWRSGQLQLAADGYEDLLEAVLMPDQKRRIMVKMRVVQDQDMQPIIGPYLMQPEGEAVSYLALAAVDLPREWLPLYLLGRRLHGDRRHAEARRAFGLTLQLLETEGDGELTSRVRFESLRLLAQCLLLSGNGAGVLAVIERAKTLTEDEALIFQLTQWAERAAWWTSAPGL